LADPVLDRVARELLASDGIHTILLYGSRADGSARADSDYDIAAFGAVARPRRIARLDAGAHLDIFVYPDSVLLAPAEDYLKLRGSRVLVQRDPQADDFLRGLDAIHRAGPAPLAADEIEARRVWARKMMARTAHADAEGNYRRVWLLQALLEDYFHIRAAWYEGPKKALRWLAEFEPVTHAAFCAALEPGASDDVIGALVERVVGAGGA
jgi:hypothetical protein